MFNNSQRPKKRLFLALILISLSLLASIIYLIWKIMVPGLNNISSYLPMIAGWLVIGSAAFALFLIICMVLAVMGMPVFKLFQTIAWDLVVFLFPLTVFLGKVVNIDKEQIERSFIELSNHLFRQKKITVPADRILILLPHCLQLDSCPHKITQDVNNCKQCGGCSIGALLQICREYGVHMAVVPGGTLARKVVKALRPKVVLAVACERDLTSGIQDVFPLPVFGVLNERPNGPCFNTCVDPTLVEKAVRNLIGLGETDEKK